MAYDASSTPEQLHADAEQWISKFREAGGGFQWHSEPDEVVWIWVPLHDAPKVEGITAAEMLAELPTHLRPAIIAIVKPHLRAGGGRY